MLDAPIEGGPVAAFAHDRLLTVALYEPAGRAASPRLVTARPQAVAQVSFLTVELLHHERGAATQDPQPRPRRGRDRRGPQMAVSARLVTDRDERVVVGRAAAARLDLRVHARGRA